MLELGFESFLGVESVSAFVSGGHFGTGTIFGRLDVDRVAVFVVANKHAGRAGAGDLDEAAGGIGVDFSGDGLVVDVDVVGALGWRIGKGWACVTWGFLEASVSGGWFADFWIWLRLGRSQVGTLLVEVTFDHGDGSGRMFSDLGGSECWKRGESASGDGGAESRKGR